MDTCGDEVMERLYVQSLKGFPSAHTCQFCEKIVLDLHTNQWQNWIRYHADGLCGFFLRLRDPPSDPFKSSRWRSFWHRFWWIGPKATLTLDVGEASEALSHSCSLYDWMFGNARNLQSFDARVDIPLRLDYAIVKSVGRKSLVSIRCPKVENFTAITLSSYQKGNEAVVFSASPIGHSLQGVAMLPPPNPTPGSQYSFALAKRWLNDCTKNHPLCRTTESRAMPKRLIHIQRDEQTKVLSVRLITCSERVDYAALSYCWGGPQPYMTTQAVAEKPIDFSALGKTIQDAIIGTENLGLQYLWVDAICIAQHDDTEKAIEIGKMADIYQGSYITISAARAASYQEGFLSPYDTDQTVRIKLKVKCPGGKISSIILQEHRKRPRKGNEFGPVMDRAWCLQEHVLAPRVLIYTSTALNFCCRTHNRSDSMNVVGGVSSFQPNALAALEKGGKTTMEAWQSIVAEFAKISITVESDRLPAISAVAQVCHEHLKVGYLAGLWTDQFYQQLAWVYTSYQDRQETYYGPSFSWVSLKKIDKIPASLHWSAGSRGSLQLLRAGVNLTAPDAPFGAVNFVGAYIRGRMKQAIWYPRGPRDNSAAAYFGLTLEKAARNKSLVDLHSGQMDDNKTERDLSSERETISGSGKVGFIDKIIADEREFLYSPAMLSERADGRVLADPRYKDNVPWVRGFYDTYEVEAALDRRIDTATPVWCLELFAPGKRILGLCDGLLLASYKAEDEDIFIQIGYYEYLSKKNGQFIKLDRRFLDDIEWREFKLE